MLVCDGLQVLTCFAMLYNEFGTAGENLLWKSCVCWSPIASLKASTCFKDIINDAGQVTVGSLLLSVDYKAKRVRPSVQMGPLGAPFGASFHRAPPKCEREQSNCKVEQGNPFTNGFRKAERVRKGTEWHGYTIRCFTTFSGT